MLSASVMDILLTNDSDDLAPDPYHPSPPQHSPSIEHIVFVVVNTFICIAGTVVNLLAIITVLRHDMKSIQNLLVLNFCLSNLLFCIIAGDTSRRMLYQPFYNEHLCRFRAYSVYVIMCSSVYSLLLVSAHRYFLVVWPPHAGLQTIKKCVLAIVIQWSCCALIMLPPLTGIWGKLGYEKATNSCTLIRQSSASYSRFIQIVNFLSPLIAQSYFYGHIFVFVKRQNNKMISSTTYTLNSEMTTRKRKQEWHITLLTFALIVTYIVCFLPYTVSTLSTLINTPFHTFAVLFLWLHLVLNPLIYIIGDRRLRKTLTGFCKCNKKADTPPEQVSLRP